jgi:hypothetical protein
VQTMPQFRWLVAGFPPWLFLYSPMWGRGICEQTCASSHSTPPIAFILINHPNTSTWYWYWQWH